MLDIKPTHKPIKEYFEELAAFEKHGQFNEMTIRNAFQDLLQTYTKKIGWQFIEEYTIQRKGRRNASIDGAILDQFSLPRGFWEAKDSKDDLAIEVRKKFEDGYPQSNILFWQPARVILYQDSRKVLDEDISTPQKLVEVLKAFFEYDQPFIKEWEHAVEEFKNTIPVLAQSVLTILEQQRSSNRPFQQAFDTFMGIVQQSINPSLSVDAVEEMLIQHLLTRRIFTTIFNAPGFLQKNAVAHELEGVIATLVQGYGSTVDDFLRPLDRFYKALEMAAGTTDDFSQKQTFLNHVYEKFFQGFAIKVADTHGIVYTPQPIVDFMVESVEAALEKDFGKSLADTGVHILDPFVGTGNFILRIMREIHEHNPSALRHKYLHELHCNEVMLMPYYIACLNIEHLYFELTGEYEAFPGICLVDTFELVEDRQMGMFTSDNTERVQRQKEAPIYVVVGNPPYNAGQVNENDNNKNRKYIAMDKRVQDTYVKDSKATYRADLNDPYVKSFRMASDKIMQNGEGILCFVTNNGFLDGIAFDGMRKHLYSDFNAVRIMDLKGNIRKDSMRDGIPLGEEHTVFGLGAMVGIAITLCEKKKNDSEHRLEYWDVNFRAKRKEKFELLEQAHDWFGLESKQLEPTSKHLWLTDGMADDWDDLIPLGSKEAKSGKANALFDIYSLGILTNRDRWVYRFNKSNLVRSMSEMSDFYNDFVAKWPYYESKKDINDFVEYDDAKISWSRDLKLKVKRSRMSTHNDSFVRTSVYRPFCKQHLCFNPIFVDQALKFPRIFPLPETENVVITVPSAGSNTTTFLASDKIVDLNFVASSSPVQCFPLYVYDEEGNNKKDNITDWGLEQFRNHYQDSPIEKIDVYHYVYGILHDPAYREKYAANLKRELPRIPFRTDFWAYAEAGKKLMDIHIKYEDQVKYPLTEEWSLPKNYVHPHGIAVNSIEQVPLQERYYVSKMKRDKNDPTKLIYNDILTISGIPSEVDEYKLGNRSALNWIIDQYQVSTDKRSGITNNPNDWSYESGNPRYILDLIQRIISVSIATNAIVKSLPKE